MQGWTEAMPDNENPPSQDTNQRRAQGSLKRKVLSTSRNSFAPRRRNKAIEERVISRTRPFCNLQ